MQQALNRFLPRTSLRDGATTRYRDLGLLYNSLYHFWLYRGAWGATLTNVVAFLNMLALWIFAFAVFFMLDWDLVVTCEGEACASRPLFHSPQLDGNMTPWHTFFAICFLLASAGSVAYELGAAVEAVCINNELHDQLRQYIRVGDRTPFHTLYFWLRRHYHGRQGHALVDSDDDEIDNDTTALGMRGAGAAGAAAGAGLFQSIEDVSWNDFLHTVLRKVLRKDTGIADRDSLDELRVAQTMHVYDNYLVALHSHHFFRRGSVLWWSSKPITRWLLSLQFDSVGRLRVPGDAVDHTRQSLWTALVVSVVLYPLVVSVFLAKLLVRHVVVARSNPRYLVEYDWTQEAYWTFRLYNEPSHLYEARLKNALDDMQRVMDDTEPPTVWHRLPHRLAEIAILVFAIVGIMNATVVTVGHFGGRAVVWWLWLALMVYGVTGAMQRQRETTHRCDELRTAVDRLFYEDVQWRRSTSAFRDNMRRHFVWPRIAVVLREFSMVLLLPAMLLWLYSRGGDELLAMATFLRDNSTFINGVGEVCAHSAFDKDPEAMARQATSDTDVGSPTDELQRGVFARTGTESDDEEESTSSTTAATTTTRRRRPAAAGGGGAAATTTGNDAGEPSMQGIRSSSSIGEEMVEVRHADDPRRSSGRRSHVVVAMGRGDPHHVAAAEGTPSGTHGATVVGAIDADVVPKAFRLRKRQASLVYFAGVYTHWAELVATGGRTEELRSVAQFVADGEDIRRDGREESAAGGDDDRGDSAAEATVTPSSHRWRSTRKLQPVDPHDVAHWHTARFFDVHQQEHL